MDDAYSTIKSEAVDEFKVKGSRFIGRTLLVSTMEDAQKALDGIRKQEYQATHNCFAYLVGTDKQAIQFKYSDDGEPSGTAGRPIYDVIYGSGLTNLLIVVTRYYGGTKLGTGGLVRAYSDSARQVLEKSGRREHFHLSKLVVTASFGFYDGIRKQVAALGARQTEAEFSDKVRMEIEIRRSLEEKLQAALIEATNGKALIEKPTEKD